MNGTKNDIMLTEEYVTDLTEQNADAESETVPKELLPVDEPPIRDSAPPINTSEGSESKAETKRSPGALGMFFCLVFLAVMAGLAIRAKGGITKNEIQNVLVSEVFGAGAVVTEAVPPAEKGDQSVPLEENGTDGTETPEEAPNETYPIVPYDLSAGGDRLFDLSNETAYSPDAEKLLSASLATPTVDAIGEEYGEGAPSVLIIHTHGTESYSPEGADSYSPDGDFRCENGDGSVIAVGNVMAEVFESAGIGTVHLTEMFDLGSYKDSYSRASAAIRETKEKYPSISYVFDIHRDSVIKTDLSAVKTSAATESGLDMAQVMIVVGTDEGGADHPTWENNLTLALKVQEAMYSENEGLPRRINLRHAAFNQGLSSGALLFEVGTYGNTLAEAKRGAVGCAAAISKVISGGKIRIDAEKMIKELVG